MKTSIAELLTLKQKTFCDEYLVDRNATAAAIRAGYSKKTALGGYLMTIPKIKMYLREQHDERAQNAQVNADMVLRELCKIAFSNMGNYFDTDGTMKPMHNLSDDEKAALWNVSVTDTGSGSKTEAGEVVKLRMYNKLSALDKIAKCLNMYKPEVKQPEIVYAYADKARLDAYDYFDDVDLQDATNWDKEEGSLKPEAGSGKQGSGGSLKQEVDSTEQGIKESMVQEDIVPVDDEGKAICDGAGIPYGKARPTFLFNLSETVEQMHARLKLYDEGDDSAAVSEVNVMAPEPKARIENFGRRGRENRERGVKSAAMVYRRAVKQ
jgi:phage terminase small subunit